MAVAAGVPTLDGEAVPDFRGDASGLCGLGINRDPLSASASEEFAVALAEHFDETLEGQPCRLADPGAQNNFVTEGGGRFVIDLVPQHDPANFIARGNGRGSIPMRGRYFLDPADVNCVVDVVLPIDVVRLDGERHFKRRDGFAHAALYGNRAGCRNRKIRSVTAKTRAR